MKCNECDGKGYEVRVETRTEAAHAPNCDGYTCSSTCPIPVPVPEYVREPCQACQGSGSNLVAIIVQIQCDVCDGKGVVRGTSMGSDNTDFEEWEDGCDWCGGHGWMLADDQLLGPVVEVQGG